jgi:hypothetical protein
VIDPASLPVARALRVQFPPGHGTDITVEHPFGGHVIAALYLAEPPCQLLGGPNVCHRDSVTWHVTPEHKDAALVAVVIG